MSRKLFEQILDRDVKDLGLIRDIYNSEGMIVTGNAHG